MTRSAKTSSTGSRKTKANPKLKKLKLTAEKIQTLSKRLTIQGTMIDIESFGAYRRGLTDEEIKEYLKLTAEGLPPYTSLTKKDVSALWNKFTKIAGANTCTCAPDGTSLMYRHDVKRFADVLFFHKPTYFD